MMSRTLLAALALLAVLSACHLHRKESPDLIILHTGRIRGNAYPLSLPSMAPLQHYQYLAGYIRKVREEAASSGARVVLVDLGDSLTGSFAAHVTNSENMVTFFNETGYDAVVLSNLDFAVQPATLRRLKAAVLNPFANTAGRPATDGTAFGCQLDADGTPIFLLANFYGDVAASEAPDRFPAWFGSTPADVAPVRDYRKVLDDLGPRPPGSLTLLSWMKFEPPNTPPAAFLDQLTQLGVNAILAHRIYSGGVRDAWATSGFYDWKPPVSANILRNNGGFALARLDLKRDGPCWRVLHHQLLPMTANTAPADRQIIQAISRFAPAISAADQPLAELPAPVDEGRILKIYMSALTTLPGSTAIAYSPQSIRTDWPASTLRASQVFNSLPWTSAIVQLDLTQDQLATACGQLRLDALRSDQAAGPTLRVTTSEFFARLIVRRLGLPADAILSTSHASEFDFFSAFLKANPDAVTAGLPTGWSELPTSATDAR